MFDLKFLIIGCGSIGQRHINNLLSIGIKNIEVFDSNKSLLKKVGKKFNVKTLNKLEFNNTDCTLVCTPPSTHIKLAKKAIESKSHVFIEKPLSNSLSGVSTIAKLAKKNSCHVFVGYMFRFDLGLQKVKKLLNGNTIGKVLSFDAYEGWYLPKWRPWQDYTKSYTASERLGGGIILDGSHEVNYLQWLGGGIKQVFSYYKKVHKLKVNTEGLCEILLLFNSKAIGRIHLDFVNPQYNRHCEILGENGSIKWSFEKKIIEIQKNNMKKPRKIKYDDNTNKMYVNELKYIIKCINGKKNSMLSLEEALETLKISLAIKKSGNINRPVSI